jgi:hypothetical protein
VFWSHKGITRPKHNPRIQCCGLGVGFLAFVVGIDYLKTDKALREKSFLIWYRNSKNDLVENNWHQPNQSIKS